MVKKQEKFPSEGDLIICSVIRVFDHGAFAKLDEYGDKEGFIHISEVASTWIKNIRDFVKVGQRRVAKVMGVHPQKGHIDLSLRRVGEAQRKNKMQEWKRAQKADKLMEMAAEKLGKDLNAAYADVGFKMGEEYGDIYSALEEISVDGEKVLEGLEVPKEWIEPIVSLARENVEIPLIKISGYLDLRSTAPDGVEVIKRALSKAAQIGKKAEEVGIEIRYVGSPRYRITVTAQDYKVAEEEMRIAAERASSELKKVGGSVAFSREAKE